MDVALRFFMDVFTLQNKQSFKHKTINLYADKRDFNQAIQNTSKQKEENVKMRSKME